MARLLLHDLPPEVLTHVANNVEPGDIVNFALACKGLFQCAGDALILHRQRHVKYARVQDIDAFEIPQLMKDIVRDPGVAWYIRKMVFWTRRIAFKEWKPHKFSEHYDGDGDTELDQFDYGSDSDEWEFEYEEDKIPKHILSYWLDDDLDYFYRTLKENLQLPKDMMRRWTQQLRNGSQEVLKCLLSTLCPEATLVIVKCGADFGDENNNCLVQFKEAIDHHVALEGVPTSVFPGLRHVYLQYPSSRTHPHDQFLLSSLEVAALMKLRSLRTLSAHLVGYADDDDFDPASVWTHQDKTSNVESIFLQAGDMHEDSVLAMVKAAKALKSLKVLDLTPLGIEKILRNNHSDTLEELFLVNPAADEYTITSLQTCRSLKHLAVCEINLATWRSKSPRDESELMVPGLHYLTWNDVNEDNGEGEDHDHEDVQSEGNENDDLEIEEEAEEESESNDGQSDTSHPNQEVDTSDVNADGSDGLEDADQELHGEENEELEEIGEDEDPDSNVNRLISWIDMRELLPPSIETVCIGGPDENVLAVKLVPGFVRIITDLIAAKPTSFPSLSGICLRQILFSRTGRTMNTMKPLSSDLDFCVDLVRVAKEQQVEIAFGAAESTIFEGGYELVNVTCPVCPVSHGPLGDSKSTCSSFH